MLYGGVIKFTTLPCVIKTLKTQKWHILKAFVSILLLNSNNESMS